MAAVNDYFQDEALAIDDPEVTAEQLESEESESEESESEDTEAEEEPPAKSLKSTPAKKLPLAERPCPASKKKSPVERPCPASKKQNSSEKAKRPQKNGVSVAFQKLQAVVDSFGASAESNNESHEELLANQESLDQVEA